ncbi:hypothetical protein B0H14DRAFT_2591942 [Mycena olivaceomarginata]|nr:hypothetical protein B0H14DRAFT_2591942 [Mycena olivaceomarginata]
MQGKDGRRKAQAREPQWKECGHCERRRVASRTPSVRAMVGLRECGDEGGGADRLRRGVAWWGEWMSAQTNARRWIDQIDRHRGRICHRRAPCIRWLVTGRRGCGARAQRCSGDCSEEMRNGDSAEAVRTMRVAGRWPTSAEKRRECVWQPWLARQRRASKVYRGDVMRGVYKAVTCRTRQMCGGQTRHGAGDTGGVAKGGAEVPAHEAEAEQNGGGADAGGGASAGKAGTGAGAGGGSGGCEGTGRDVRTELRQRRGGTGRDGCGGADVGRSGEEAAAAAVSQKGRRRGSCVEWRGWGGNTREELGGQPRLGGNKGGGLMGQEMMGRGYWGLAVGRLFPGGRGMGL